MGRLLRGHTINFDYVGNGSNYHFTLAHDPLGVDIEGMAQVSDAGIYLLD